MDRCIYIGVVYDLFNLFPFKGAAMAVLPEIVSVHVLELCVNFLLEYKFGNLFHFKMASECPYLKMWVPA